MTAGLLSRLSPQPILVVGDLILDTYTIGKVGRISPEAPVGIVHVHSEEAKPGGACNVALNLISLGSTVQLMGRIGSDLPGRKLMDRLNAEGVDVSAILSEPGHKTPHKNRVIADNQQIIRIDHEEVSPLSIDAEAHFIQMMPQFIFGKKAVAISDYGKGLLTPKLLRAIIDEARKQKVPVIVDPKGSDFSRYSGATLVKPNQGEAYAAAGKTTSATLDEVAASIFEDCRIDYLMITRSQHGISVFDRTGTRNDFPAQVREILDVTGAGDTVLAMVAQALANALSPSEASLLANAAAGIAVEHIGCARVSLAELAQKLLADNSDNKVFDDAHLYALKQALNGTKSALIDFLGTDGMPQKVYRAITTLKDEGFAILLAVGDVDADTLHLFTALRDIDFIIHKGAGLTNLCELLEPQRVYITTSDGLQPFAELAVN